MVETCFWSPVHTPVGTFLSVHTSLPLYSPVVRCTGLCLTSLLLSLLMHTGTTPLCFRVAGQTCGHLPVPTVCGRPQVLPP